MNNKQENFNLLMALIPQVFRFGYKIFQAWKSGGIDADEAKDLVEELFTILIFVLEEFEMKLEVEEDEPEEAEDGDDELFTEDEGEYIEEEIEVPEQPVKAPRKKLFKRGKK